MAEPARRGDGFLGPAHRRGVAVVRSPLYVRFWVTQSDETIVERLDDPTSTYNEVGALRWDEEFCNIEFDSDELVCGVVLDG